MTTDVTATDSGHHDADATDASREAVAWDGAATTVRSRLRPTEGAVVDVTAAVRADAAETAATELQRALRALDERTVLDDRERAVLRALAGRIVDGVVGAPAGRANDLAEPANADAVLELFDVDAGSPDVAASAEVDDVE